MMSTTIKESNQPDPNSLSGTQSAASQLEELLAKLERTPKGSKAHIEILVEIGSFLTSSNQSGSSPISGSSLGVAAKGILLTLSSFLRSTDQHDPNSPVGRTLARMKSVLTDPNGIVSPARGRYYTVQRSGDELLTDVTEYLYGSGEDSVMSIISEIDAEVQNTDNPKFRTSLQEIRNGEYFKTLLETVSVRDSSLRTASVYNDTDFKSLFNSIVDPFKNFCTLLQGLPEGEIKESSAKFIYTMTFGSKAEPNALYLQDFLEKVADKIISTVNYQGFQDSDRKFKERLEAVLSIKSDLENSSDFIRTRLDTVWEQYLKSFRVYEEESESPVAFSVKDALKSLKGAYPLVKKLYRVTIGAHVMKAAAGPKIVFGYDLSVLEDIPAKVVEALSFVEDIDADNPTKSQVYKVNSAYGILRQIEQLVDSAKASIKKAYQDINDHSFQAHIQLAEEKRRKEDDQWNSLLSSGSSTAGIAQLLRIHDWSFEKVLTSEDFRKTIMGNWSFELSGYAGDAGAGILPQKAKMVENAWLSSIAILKDLGIKLDRVLAAYSNKDTFIQMVRADDGVLEKMVQSYANVVDRSISAGFLGLKQETVTKRMKGMLSSLRDNQPVMFENSVRGFDPASSTDSQGNPLRYVEKIAILNAAIIDRVRDGNFDIREYFKSEFYGFAMELAEFFLSSNSTTFPNYNVEKGREAYLGLIKLPIVKEALVNISDLISARGGHEVLINMISTTGEWVQGLDRLVAFTALSSTSTRSHEAAQAKEEFINLLTQTRVHPEDVNVQGVSSILMGKSDIERFTQAHYKFLASKLVGASEKKKAGTDLALGELTLSGFVKYVMQHAKVSDSQSSGVSRNLAGNHEAIAKAISKSLLGSSLSAAMSLWTELENSVKGATQKQFIDSLQENNASRFFSMLIVEIVRVAGSREYTYGASYRAKFFQIFRTLLSRIPTTPTSGEERYTQEALQTALNSLESSASNSINGPAEQPSEQPESEEQPSEQPESEDQSTEQSESEEQSTEQAEREEQPSEQQSGNEPVKVDISSILGESVEIPSSDSGQDEESGQGTTEISLVDLFNSTYSIPSNTKTIDFAELFSTPLVIPSQAKVVDLSGVFGTSLDIPVIQKVVDFSGVFDKSIRIPLPALTVELPQDEVWGKDQVKEALELIAEAVKGTNDSTRYTDGQVEFDENNVTIKPTSQDQKRATTTTGTIERTKADYIPKALLTVNDNEGSVVVGKPFKTFLVSKSIENDSVDSLIKELFFGVDETTIEGLSSNSEDPEEIGSPQEEAHQDSSNPEDLRDDDSDESTSDDQHFVRRDASKSGSESYKDLKLLNDLIQKARALMVDRKAFFSYLMAEVAFDKNGARIIPYTGGVLNPSEEWENGGAPTLEDIEDQLDLGEKENYLPRFAKIAKGLPDDGSLDETFQEADSGKIIGYIESLQVISVSTVPVKKANILEALREVATTLPASTRGSLQNLFQSDSVNSKAWEGQKAKEQAIELLKTFGYSVVQEGSSGERVTVDNTEEEEQD